MKRSLLHHAAVITAALGASLLAGCREAGRPAAVLPLQKIDPPSAAGAMGPSLAIVGGSPALTWLEPAGAILDANGRASKWRLRFARLGGTSWSPPVTLAEGEGLVANWADFPGVGVSGPSVVAHWLAAVGDDKYAYTIFLAGSNDAGATWRPLGRLPADEAAAEHGFASWLSQGDSLRAFWLDGREMPAGGPMTLRTASVDVRSGSANEAKEELVDDRVCDCCQTDSAMTSDGPVVVYRDRSPEEIRDIAIRRLTPGGWSAPALVHADGWHIEGCPVNGPAVAAQGRKVAVAWFTGAPTPRVQLAFSDDSGATFSAPVRIDRDDEQNPLGRLDLVLDAGGDAIVSRIGRPSGDSTGAAVLVRRVPRNGPAGPDVPIARVDGGRASGFPRMLLEDREHLLIAWTDAGEQPGVRVARLELSSLSQAAP